MGMGPLIAMLPRLLPLKPRPEEREEDVVAAEDVDWW
jgi:hypothetical protein